MSSQERAKPSLSIIVVAYRMPEQLENTLFTLSSAYQQNVSPDDYQALSGTIDLTGDNDVIKLKIEKQVKDQ